MLFHSILLNRCPFAKSRPGFPQLLISLLSQGLSPGNSGRMGALSVNCSAQYMHLYCVVRDGRHLFDYLN